MKEHERMNDYKKKGRRRKKKNIENSKARMKMKCERRNRKTTAMTGEIMRKRKESEKQQKEGTELFEKAK